MKTLLFDLSVCQPIGESKFHGAGVYGYIVLKELIKICSNNIIIYLNEDAYIPPDIMELIKKNQTPYINASNDSLVKVIKNNDNLIIYSPLWSNKYFDLFPLSTPIIYTQHGLRALEMNRDTNEWIFANSIRDKLKAIIKQTFIFKYIQQKYYNSYYRIFKYPYAKIITVSYHSKSSILYHYPFVDKSRITVCYSPDTTESINPSDRLIESEYYLIVSANRWLKNSLRAIIAFDRIIDRDMSNRKMMVVGLKPNKRLLKEIKNLDSFVFLPYLERFDLESAYKNAYALIYPSLNEGFGYPPMEAMKYGVPVIASPFSSIPEVCGEAVVYANPTSIDEIAMRIIQIEDSKFYKEYSERAIKRFNYISNIQHEHLKNLISIILNTIKQ